MYKLEIERRLNKTDYTRLPRLLGFQNTYDNTNSTDELKNMLEIADINGSKYIELYQLKTTADISRILQNLVSITYQPNIPYIENQGDLSIIKVSSNGLNFEILADFYMVEEVWHKSEDGRAQTLIPRHLRKVLHLRYNHVNRKLILTIDPIGDGVKIAEDIRRYINIIFQTYNINFYEFFEIVDIDNAIYTMIDNHLLRPKRVKSKDDNSNRIYDTLAQNPNDSLSDEAIFTDTRSNTLNLDRMRLKHDNFNINVELFGNDLLKIWSRANWEQSDGIKENIIEFL
ncbi:MULTISPECIES: hypothetical protein [unclassified Sulfuricurvum]|uniref:hypothetical protein n=1 Tax=unclassified Sulfuricurvum TaxID=2632390 RepID=UPI0025FD3913|nr:MULTISPECIES: hypothetical protein [unclassified Sulfuricurvum]